MTIRCPVCGIPVALTKRGHIYKHENRNLPQVWHPDYPKMPCRIWQTCAASGKEHTWRAVSA